MIDGVASNFTQKRVKKLRAGRGYGFCDAERCRRWPWIAIRTQVLDAKAFVIVLKGFSLELFTVCGDNLLQAWGRAFDGRQLRGAR